MDWEVFYFGVCAENEFALILLTVIGQTLEKKIYKYVYKNQKKKRKKTR